MNREKRLALTVLGLAAMGVVSLYFGLYRAGVVLFLIAVAMAAAYFALIIRPARIPKDSLLRLRLSGALHEYSIGSLLDRLRGRDFVTTHHLRQALQNAAHDPALKAVMVEIASLGCGLATAQELHDLIALVRAGGKRTIAVLDGDAAGAREYLIAAAAGEIIANPDTSLMMLGVTAGNFFLKRALENLHIQAQSLQWKEYKGAGEIFSREQMSPALRESIETVVADWEKVLIDYVARARGLAPERAKELLNGGFLSSRGGRDSGLLDRIGYAQDVLAEFDSEPKRKKVIGLGRYLRRVAYQQDKGKRPRIALIYGLGPVIADEPPMAGEFLSGEQTAHEFTRAANDPRVRAVVFRVNSPGGSAVGSDMVWRAVRETQERGKPVVVSMGDVAGSGGYYVAMAADAIVAQPATVTGSIGVVYVKFSLGELLSRIGINVEFAKSGSMGDALSVTRALTQPELEQLNQVMGEIYENFSAKVAQGRKLAAEQAEAVARGRIWSGSAALTKGLVDALGGMAQAVELAREKARLGPGEDHELTLYSPMRGLMALQTALAPTAHRSWWTRPIAQIAGVPEPWLPSMAHLLSNCRALLLCPWF